jgi:ribosomal protein S18 acetylase RimI-like enzyme
MREEIIRLIKRDAPVRAEEIEALRLSVGWEKFENKYDRVLAHSYTHFTVREEENLVGFLNIISDGVGDAFLVDLIVHPDIQRRGYGRALVAAAVAALTEDGIKCIQVTFNPHLASFYRSCGLYIFRAGIIDTDVKLTVGRQRDLAKQPAPAISYIENPPIDNAALNQLFENAWQGHRWRDFLPVLQRSLLYVCAFDGTQLVGFVNVAWDGGAHGFILDTTVHRDFQRRGIGQRLLVEAAGAAREKGVEWLHVDFVPELESFYRKAGFDHTAAGLLRLQSTDGS